MGDSNGYIVIKVLPSIVRYVTSLREGKEPEAERLLRIEPGELLGKNCMLCRKSIRDGGPFIVCPNCFNIYCLECAKSIEVCMNCGSSLIESIESGRKSLGG